jgi:hypothetical protein
MTHQNSSQTQQDDLQARKIAFATTRSIEPCVNAACGHGECECGPRCECGGVALGQGRDPSTRVTCEPCVEFVKRRKQLEGD